MTTHPPESTDRLDRIEQILETVVTQQAELTARQTAFQTQLERQNEELTARQVAFQAQLERQNEDLDREFEFIGTSLGRLEQQIASLAQQAEQDRNQASIDRAEFRSTVEQLLQVLTQQLNGNGGRSGCPPEG